MLDDNIKEIIKNTIIIVNNQTKDWFIIKKLLITQFPPKKRSKFSRRHYSTRKHTLNSFDNEILKYWEELTGVNLWVDPNKIHPKWWKRHRRGWGLKKYNAQRKRQIEILDKQNRKRRDLEDK